MDQLSLADNASVEKATHVSPNRAPVSRDEKTRASSFSLAKKAINKSPILPRLSPFVRYADDNFSHKLRPVDGTETAICFRRNNSRKSPF